MLFCNERRDQRRSLRAPSQAAEMDCVAAFSLTSETEGADVHENGMKDHADVLVTHIAEDDDTTVIAAQIEVPPNRLPGRRLVGVVQNSSRDGEQLRGRLRFQLVRLWPTRPLCRERRRCRGGHFGWRGCWRDWRVWCHRGHVRQYLQRIALPPVTNHGADRSPM